MPPRCPVQTNGSPHLLSTGPIDGPWLSCLGVGPWSTRDEKEASEGNGQDNHSKSPPNSNVIHCASAASLDPTNWTLEDSLDFIEGNRSGKPGRGAAVGQKKQAKKERQWLASGWRRLEGEEC